MRPQDPDAFQPERFLAGTPEAAAAPEHGWVPFGEGVRACIGLRYGACAPGRQTPLHSCPRILNTAVIVEAVVATAASALIVLPTGAALQICSALDLRGFQHHASTCALRFAWEEAKTALLRLCQRFTFELEPGHVRRPSALCTNIWCLQACAVARCR